MRQAAPEVGTRAVDASASLNGWQGYIDYISLTKGSSEAAFREYLDEGMASHPRERRRRHGSRTSAAGRLALLDKPHLGYRLSRALTW
jgi:hypothetical protein